MRLLKQSTEVTERIGPCLDKTDGVTEEAGLAGAGTEISKAGGAYGAGPVLGTYDSDGWYPVTLTTTHTNTLGSLVLKVHDAATHLPVWHEFLVLPANVYDSIVAGSDVLDVSVTQWLGTAAATPTVAGVPEIDVTLVGGAAQDIATATALATVDGVVDAILLDTGTDGVVVAAASKTGYALSAAGVQAVWDALSSALTTVGSIGKRLVDYLTGDVFARLGAPAGASVSADVAAVKVDTAAILDDTGTAGVVVAAGSKTGYSLTATTGLGNQTANITGDLSGSVGSVTGAVGSVTGAVGSVTGTVGGVAGTITTLDALDTAQDAQHATTQGGVAALNDLSSADVTAAVPTVAQVSDGVWDEAKAGHVAAGSFGEEVQAHALSSEVSALNDLTAAEVNAEVDTAITDAALATAANLATVDTVVDAIKAKTDSLTFTKAGEVDANVQSVNGTGLTGTGVDGNEWGPA
jgi:hypothetical protein